MRTEVIGTFHFPMMGVTCWIAQRRSSPLVAVAAVLVLIVTACSPSGDGETTASLEASWRQRAEAALGHYPDANEAQLEVFERSLERGEVTYEDYHERMMAFVSCLEGSVTTRVDVDDGWEKYGLPWIQVGFETSDDAATEERNLALFERCAAVESDLISDLYESQPSATRWYNAHLANYVDEITACLAAEGETPPKGATADEILHIDSERNIDAPQRTPCVITSGFLATTLIRRD